MVYRSDLKNRQTLETVSRVRIPPPPQVTTFGQTVDNSLTFQRLKSILVLPFQGLASKSLELAKAFIGLTKQKPFLQKGGFLLLVFLSKISSIADGGY